ncbi:thymidine phosphorylase [Microcaecilia unicolor]|uniref:Thymidine phosphorylase n=1 Tax=Microcaecilia unicolor TaxID=1415580 RepID=A0A6P7Z676_9AMPH|nr:thymidine phosphorylase [Microcaecilia unicolor]XP_030072986.1 thymidine phosphorylase [Microcaecilia unicolor]XP_030072987.1 thymidine phosphorylase [Microcaecilia unicolor]XP_030072988.1 thymidine phosphorylase [Microcaecilia unicolor]
MASGKNLSFPELIRKKRDGEKLQKKDIQHFIQAVKHRSIQDSQIGALLMAIRLCGMEPEETQSLTQEMILSGKVLEWPESWHGLIVDKHSTGGVGDKISLPLAPALAACGCKVPMISGRALLHTGGTLDKLESVPGYNVNQTTEQMRTILEEVGCCIIGQTEELVPADKILYAIRDVTATVDSLPLITSSIICKKAAESLNALVLDVKYGSAAIYKTLESARVLAQSMVTVGNQLGINTTALLTTMDYPLGKRVGNSLEVIESLECLKGRGPDDLRELVIRIGGYLLWMCQKAKTPESGCEMIGETLDNGSALRKFQAMLEAQGVKQATAQALCAEKVDYFQIFRCAQCQEVLHSENGGTVETIQAMTLADVLNELGAGRSKAGQSINLSVGAELLVDVGQRITKGTPWIRIHYEKPELQDSHRHALQAALVLSDCPPFTPGSRITEILTPQAMK